MKTSDLPFNVTLMALSSARLSTLKPVRSLDIYDGASTNFHEDGLFSISIFGRVGEEARDTRLSYIDIKTSILHPIIYSRLVRLKGLYKGIMSGREYAVWSNEEKDFISADELTGKTGYHFFMSQWKNIVFKDTKSDVRQQRVAVIEKFKDIALIEQVLVLPAGLRDIHIDESGRRTEDEINEKYRRIISISNTIGNSEANKSTEVLNVPRHSLQLAFNEVYDMLERMLTGKSGFLQSKWGSRRIFNGTRNVISAMDTSSSYLGGDNSPKFTDSAMGLYQVIKGALPVTIHCLLKGWCANVFGDANGQAKLVDKKTLKPEFVQLDPEVHDRWTTAEGLEKIISLFSEPGRRHEPVDVEGRYLGLIYIDDEANFKIFGNIDELPDGFNPAFVKPLTLCHLIYLSGYKRWNKLIALITRYPVAGLGSIYPSRVYVKTTIVGEKRWELGEDWERIGEDSVALEFPTGEPLAYVDSLIPHPSRLLGLTADYDGDTSSANILYSDDSIAEMDKFFKNKNAYLDPNGGLKASCDVDTVSLVLRNMTGDPE